MNVPPTLGELRKSSFSEQRLRTRKVKDELRENLIARLRSGETIFPGIIGYEDTVVPQLVNAVLSRHNFILLGLRGQAKSRILRALTTLLDPQLPYVAGCEIRDNPYDPICTANPEDYTARGKIGTPLKDRIGSEIRTHYPGTLEEGISITEQEAWLHRDGLELHVPKYVREVVERVAFLAREDKKIDKRSGVSQRLPISVLENVISNAERRAVRSGEQTIVPRIGDVYAALPSITGKLELEYEGEMRGADTVARELIRTAVAKTYDTYFKDLNMQQVVQWFELGGEIKLSDTASAHEVLEGLKNIQGLTDKLAPVGIKSKDKPEVLVSAAEFVLEGLHAHRRIGRSEERVFGAEKQPKRQERPFERGDDEPPPMRNRRPYN